MEDVIFLYVSQCEHVATIFWSIWKTRIVKLWQQVHETNFQFLERATYFLEEWKLANDI